MPRAARSTLPDKGAMRRADCFGPVLRAASLVAAATCLVFGAAGAGHGQEDESGPLIGPKIWQGDGFQIATPASWKADLPVRLPTLLGVRGQGVDGFPKYDGVLEPLEVGIHVTRYSAQIGRIEFVAKAWKKKIENSRREPILGKVSQREIRLQGDVSAILLTVRVRKGDTRRRAYYHAVVTADSKGRVYLVLGYMNYDLASEAFLKKIKLEGMLIVHVESLTLNGQKLNARRLAPAYRAYAWGYDKAVQKTLFAIHLLRRNERTRAMSALVSAVESCPEMPAARQRLAWIYLSSRDPGMYRPKIGLRHAEKAVELTDYRDLSSVDTLALAYTKTGQRAKAARLLRQALERDPGNEKLRQRLSLLDGN